MRAMRFAAGVHASGGFGIGGPIRPATEYPTPDEEIYVRSVIDQLQWRLRKGAAIRSLGMHFYLLFFVLVVVAFRDSPNSVKESNHFLKTVVIGESEVQSLSNSSEVLSSYLPSLIERCWRTRKNGSSAITALNFVPIRQLRLRSTVLEASAVAQRAPLEEVGFYFPFNWAIEAPTYLGKSEILTESHLDTDPIIYSNGRWKSNFEIEVNGTSSEKAFSYLGQPVMTRERLWPRTPRSYSILPLLFKDINDTQNIREHLQLYSDGNWISVFTAVVVADAFFYDPHEESFFHATSTIQIERSVRLVSTVRIHPFYIRSLSPRHFAEGVQSGAFWFQVLLVVVDCMMLLGALWSLVDMIRRVRVNRELENSWLRSILRFWEIYEVALIMLILAVVTGHVYLLVIGSKYKVVDTATLDIVPQVDNANFLARYSYPDSIISTLRGWLSLVVMLRSFQLLQFLSRLSVVTETVQTAAQDIIGVGVILAVILFGFSIGGLFLYGNNVTEFSSLTESFTFFAQLVGSGELRGYDTQEQVHWSAAIYYLLFFFIAYFVLLNVIIGILAASFVTTVETFDLVKRADWSPEALRKDLVGIWRRLNPRKYGEGRTAEDGETEEFDGMAAISDRSTDLQTAVLESSWDESNGVSWIAAHLRLLDALRPLADAKGSPKNPEEEGSITLQQLRSLGGAFFPQQQIDVLFAKAQSQLGTRNGKIRHVRLLSRRNMKGSMLMDRVAEQYTQVLAIKTAILGSDALKEKDEPEKLDQGGAVSKQAGPSRTSKDSFVSESGPKQADGDPVNESSATDPLQDLAYVINDVAESSKELELRIRDLTREMKN